MVCITKTSRIKSWLHGHFLNCTAGLAEHISYTHASSHEYIRDLHKKKHITLMYAEKVPVYTTSHY